MPLKLFVAIAAAAAATFVNGQDQPQFTGLRGANTWYNFLGPSNESDTLLAVTYLQENLVQYGYNIYTLDEGWAENGKLLIDGNGLPEWNQVLYPSGLPSLAARMKQMGVGLGVWLMRGIPREAVENKLPIANSNYTCDQAVRMDGNCSWNSHTFASNGSPAAAAYYASLANKLVSWGITLVKMDCLWPHLYEGTPQPFFNEDVEGASSALKAAGLILSMSPGISVSPFNASYVAAGSRAALYRIAEDVLDVYEGKPDGTFPQGVHQKFTKALEFEAFLGVNGTTPDFDMLQLGRVVHGYGSHELPPTETHLTPTEQATSFSLFCFTGVPLILGGRLPLDATPNGTATLAILTQRELLGVHNASASRRSFTPTLATATATATTTAHTTPLQQGAAELYGWVNTPSDPAGRIPPGDSAKYVGVWNAGVSEGGVGVGVRVRFTQDASLPPSTQQVCVRDLARGTWEEPVGGDLGGGVFGLTTSVEDHGGRTLLLTTVGSPVCRTGLA